MKLKKIECQYSNGKLHYRYFEDEKTNLQGYYEFNRMSGVKDKCYFVNNNEIMGLDIYKTQKYYNI